MQGSWPSWVPPRGWAVGVLGVVFGLGSLTACPATTTETASSEARIDVQRYRAELMPDDLALGGETPLVTIVVFTDYACPPCGKTWQVMDNLLEDYGDDLRVVYRSYTVPGFGRGEQAAEAAFAAAAQGKFWEFHRRLFAHPGTFDKPTLRAHAAAVGLDVPKFEDDLHTGANAGMMLRHRRQAKALGVVGLPAMFVNGVYLAGFSDEDTWHGLVDAEMAHAKQLIAEGTPRAELYASIMAKASTGRVAPPKGAKELRASLPKADGKVDLTPADPKKRYNIAPGEHTVGPDDAPVVVIQFTDVQCPFCRRAWNEELEALIDKRKGEVKFAMRHLPLAIHPAARGCAIALEAAAKQGKFWPYYDKLIGWTKPVGRNVFVELATELELDVGKFVADLDDPALAKRVESDAREALAVGVTGTPGFFVNGKVVRSYRPGQLDKLIDAELQAVQARVESGTPRDEVFETLMAEAVQPKDFPNQ